MPFILLPNNINRVVGNHLSSWELLTSPATLSNNARHRNLPNMCVAKTDINNSGSKGGRDGSYDRLTFCISFLNSILSHLLFFFAFYLLPSLLMFFITC